MPVIEDVPGKRRTFDRPALHDGGGMHVLFVRTDVVDDVPVETVDLLESQATARDVGDHVLHDIRSPLQIIGPYGVA